MHRRLQPIRRRLWPPRWEYAERQARLESQLEALLSATEQAAAAPREGDRQVDELSEQVRQLTREVARLSEQLVRAEIEHAELRTRTRRTQALVARTYEAVHDWPAKLAAARTAPDYELAYTDRTPLISVPIPTFHSPDTLCERALASVQAQTYSNWEAIVVGDHCTDDTRERVTALGDPRIRFHNLPARENDPDDPWERWAVKGSVPRATGIALSRGRWIAALSHDDAWDPDHLETLLAAARDSHAEVVYSGLRLVAAELPDRPEQGEIGAWPPTYGQFCWQASLAHAHLDFLRYDRNCALASEPNDWNLARRAWEAGVRFHHVSRPTVSLYVYDRNGAIVGELAARGLPPEAQAAP